MKQTLSILTIFILTVSFACGQKQHKNSTTNNNELIDSLAKQAEQKGLSLMVTIFNGDYVGYCPVEEDMSVAHRETRYMNWLGAQAGNYFNELVQTLISETKVPETTFILSSEASLEDYKP